MSLKRLGGETMIYGLANVLPRLLNFVVLVPFLTGVFNAEDYGVASELFVYIAFLIALLTFRMDTVVFRFASREGNDPRAVFRRAQNVVLTAVVVCIGIAMYFAVELATWLSYPDRDVYVQLFLLTVAFDALSAVPQARLRLDGRAWAFVAINMGNVLINLGLVFLLLYFWPRWGTMFGLVYDEQLQVVYYLIAIATAAAARYLVLLLDGWWTYRKVADTGTGSAYAPPLKEMLAYSAPLVVVALAAVFNAQSGIPIIKRFYGDDISGNQYWSGQFAAALKFAVILNLFVTAFNYAAEPFFFRQAGSDLSKADRTIYADATRAYAIVGSLVCAAIMIFLPWIKNFLGRDLQEGLYVLPFILAGNFFLGLYSNFAIAYKLTDKTYLGGLIATVGSVVSFGVGVGFIGQYGILAPAAAMTACYLTMCVLAYLLTRRIFPVRYPVGRIVLYAILAAAAAYGARALDAGLVGSMAVFTLLLVLMGALEYRWAMRVFRGVAR